MRAVELEVESEIALGTTYMFTVLCPQSCIQLIQACNQMADAANQLPSVQIPVSWRIFVKNFSAKNAEKMQSFTERKFYFGGTHKMSTIENFTNYNTTTEQLISSAVAG
jgi:hypothetical protein